MFLIFGPNDTYFFDDRKGNRKWRAWPAFDNYMSSRTVGEITNIAFGEDEAFFINHLDGGNILRQHRNYMEDPQDRYGPFKSWAFFENVSHNRESVNVCFGVGGSFFAKSSEGHRWGKVPEGVTDYYQKFTRLDLFMKSRVNTVDLGHNGTYLGIGVDNTWFWQLGDEYTELSRLLGRKGVDSCQWISINPFKPQQHFVAFSDGSIHWALPAHWIQDMQSIIKKYAAERGANIPQSPPTYGPNSFFSTHTQDPFAQFTTQLNAALPHPSPPTLPPRPARWPSSSASPPPPPQQSTNPYYPHTSSTPQYVQSPGGGATLDWNQYMQSTQDILGMYNNTLGAGQSQAQTNAQQLQAQLAAAQAQAYQPYGLTAAGQTTGDSVASGIDTLNNGIQIVNSLTDTGNMLGQFVIQGAGAAAACCVM